MDTIDALPRTYANDGPSRLHRDDPGYATPSQRRAHHDYLRSLLAELPDPEKLIWHLPDAVVAALLGAWRSDNACRRVCESACFSWGLCDRDGFLTAYGMKVRHALLESEG